MCSGQVDTQREHLPSILVRTARTSPTIKLPQALSGNGCALSRRERFLVGAWSGCDIHVGRVHFLPTVGDSPCGGFIETPG